MAVRKSVFYLLLALLGLAAAELLLAFAGKAYFFLQARGGREDAFRIVALGESTTQGGAGVRKDWAYPGQLEIALLKQCKRPVSVTNLGVAGTQTWQIRGLLPSQLKKYRPHLVTAMMGINDYAEGKALRPFRERSWISRAMRGTHLFKVGEWATEVLAGRGAKEGSRLAPADSPETIVIKMEAGLELDNWDFSRRVSEPLLRAGDFEAAQALLQRVIRAWPNHTFARLAMADLYQVLKNDPASATPYFEASAVLVPEGRQWTPFIRLRLAEWYLKIGAKKKFHQTVDQVFSRPQESSLDYLRVADIYLREREFSRARALLEKAKPLFPRSKRIPLLLETIGALEAGKARPELEALGKVGSSAIITGFTAENYREIVERALDHGSAFLAIQYPMLDAAPLREMLHDLSARDSRLKVLSNETIFKDAVKAQGYEAVFSDHFGGDFGHTTQAGNVLLGEHIARFLLAEYPELSEWCNN